MTIEGTYQIESASDASNQAVNIPGTYTVTLEHKPHSISEYNLNMQIGNSMGTTLTVDCPADESGTASVHLSMFRSTMMMPPKPVYEFEQFLSECLRDCDRVKVDEDRMELGGSLGVVVLQRQ